MGLWQHVRGDVQDFVDTDKARKGRQDVTVFGKRHVAQIPIYVLNDGRQMPRLRRFHTAGQERVGLVWPVHVRSDHKRSSMYVFGLLVYVS